MAARPAILARTAFEDAFDALGAFEGARVDPH